MTGCLPSQQRKRLFAPFLCLKDESFQSLVQKRAFRRILSRLEDKRYASNNTDWLYQDMGYESPLHFILQQRPPLSIVELILLYTDGSYYVPEEALDSEGRTPLHIAAAHNCAFEVMERLLAGVSLVVPALTKDNAGRCPLHWACCFPALPGRGEADNKFDSILLLVDAYPHAVMESDNDGKTPIDYAKNRIMDQRITDVLQKASDSLKAHEKGGNKAKISGKPSKLVNVLGPGPPDSSSIGSGVPAEVNAMPGVSRFFLARYFFQPDVNEDDVSTLGWDRSGSSVSSISRSQSMESQRSPTRFPPGERMSPTKPTAKFSGGERMSAPIKISMLYKNDVGLLEPKSPPSVSQNTGEDASVLFPDQKQSQDLIPSSIRTKSLVKGHMQPLPSLPNPTDTVTDWTSSRRSFEI